MLSSSTKKEIREVLLFKFEKVLEDIQSDQFVSKDNYEEVIRRAAGATIEYFVEALEENFDQCCNDWGFDKLEEFDQDNFSELLDEEIENFNF